ncbi:protein of unknown function (plasmid) [Cupriavidus taiwanensis]|uniref:Uncharacterized protein n=1 Tax=Cupriavidus taiwanensis TaxID=164546 RepID=A0A375IRN8_9BURK|nr:protein of unknown function [Cupriavidus taiwanensis]
MQFARWPVICKVVTQGGSYAKSGKTTRRFPDDKVLPFRESLTGTLGVAFVGTLVALDHTMVGNDRGPIRVDWLGALLIAAGLGSIQISMELLPARGRCGSRRARLLAEAGRRADGHHAGQRPGPWLYHAQPAGVRAADRGPRAPRDLHGHTEGRSAGWLERAPGAFDQATPRACTSHGSRLKVCGN